MRKNIRCESRRVFGMSLLWEVRFDAPWWSLIFLGVFFHDPDEPGSPPVDITFSIWKAGLSLRFWHREARA